MTLVIVGEEEGEEEEVGGEEMGSVIFPFWDVSSLYFSELSGGKLLTSLI